MHFPPAILVEWLRYDVANVVARVRIPKIAPAFVAHLVEQLPLKEKVAGPIPVGGTNAKKRPREQFMMYNNKYNYKHGHGSHKLGRSSTYILWQGMKTRCSNPNASNYKYYGGRGIKVCERWEKFENFLEDMGERPEELTLDRIDNNGDYEPSNCRWATSYEQYHNKKHCATCTCLAT